MITDKISSPVIEFGADSAGMDAGRFSEKKSRNVGNDVNGILILDVLRIRNYIIRKKGVL